MHGAVIVDRARSVDNVHHFERPCLKTALIDVMALFVWAGSNTFFYKYFLQKGQHYRVHYSNRVIEQMVSQCDTIKT